MLTAAVVLVSVVGGAIALVGVAGVALVLYLVFAFGHSTPAGTVLQPADPAVLREIVARQSAVEAQLEGLAPLPSTSTSLDVESTDHCYVGYDSFTAVVVGPGISGTWTLPDGVDPIRARSEAAFLLAIAGWGVAKQADGFGQVLVATELDGMRFEGAVSYYEVGAAMGRPSISFSLWAVGEPDPCPPTVPGED